MPAWFMVYACLLRGSIRSSSYGHDELILLYNFGSAGMPIGGCPVGCVSRQPRRPILTRTVSLSYFSQLQSRPATFSRGASSSMMTAITRVALQTSQKHPYQCAQPGGKACGIDYEKRDVMLNNSP